MDKKGISDILVLALIILFVVSLATLVFLWSASFTKNIQGNTESEKEKMIACAYVKLGIRWACINESVIRLAVENLGSLPLEGLNIRVLGSSGGYQNISLQKIDVAEYKQFDVPYEYYIGTLKSIEILPRVRTKDNLIICNMPETKENIGNC